MTQLTLLTREGCHLCDAMKRVVAQVQQHQPVSLTEIDISSDVALERRFGTEIPVLMLGDRILARYRISASELKARLVNQDGDAEQAPTSPSR